MWDEECHKRCTFLDSWEEYRWKGMDGGVGRQGGRPDEGHRPLNKKAATEC